MPAAGLERCWATGRDPLKSARTIGLKRLKQPPIEANAEILSRRQTDLFAHITAAFVNGKPFFTKETTDEKIK